MRLLLTAILLAVPLVASPQDYRTSILYVAPAETTAAPGLAYVPRDSIRVGHQPNIAFPIVAGAVGGVAGMYGGLIVGASIENDPYADDITTGMALGFIAGEVLMLPVGVHLGNGRKGSFLADLAVSTVVGAGAIFVTSTSNDGTPLLIGALVQYASVVAVERVTARKRLAAKAQAQAQAP